MHLNHWRHTTATQLVTNQNPPVFASTVEQVNIYVYNLRAKSYCICIFFSPNTPINKELYHVNKNCINILYNSFINQLVDRQTIFKMLSLGPKMDGSPNTKYFECNETLAALEGVRLWLQKNGKKVL